MQHPTDKESRPSGNIQFFLNKLDLGSVIHSMYTHFVFSNYELTITTSCSEQDAEERIEHCRKNLRGNVDARIER